MWYKCGLKGKSNALLAELIVCVGEVTFASITETFEGFGEATGDW